MSVHFVNDAFESQFYHQSNKIRTNIHKYEHDAYTFLLKVFFVRLHSDWNVISLLTDTYVKKSRVEIIHVYFKNKLLDNRLTGNWPFRCTCLVIRDLIVANSHNIFF